MKLLSRGPVLLASSVALWACSGDPTDNRGTPAEITATPTSLFIVRGQSKQVVVEVRDAQGNPLLDEVSVAGGTGLTITPDPTFKSTTAADGQLRHEHAFNVTANDLVTTTFTVSSGSVSRVITVGVVPGAVDIPLATVASTGPNATDPTVLTVPAPYQFFADSQVTFNTGQGITIARSADGRSITVLPFPGASSTGTLAVAVDYLPDIPLMTTTDVPVTVSAVVPPNPAAFDPATAPEFTLAGPGGVGGFIAGSGWGAATCGTQSGAPCQLYKFTLAAETTFELEPVWSNTADVGIYFFGADGTTPTGVACDAAGNAASPGGFAEHCEDLVLPAGTYVAAVVSFGPFYAPPDPNPDWVVVRFHAAE